jgi:hypothetical protein
MTAGVLNRSLQVLAFSAAFSLLSPAPPGWADPITVTSGQFTVAWDDVNFFQLFGADGFALSGLFVGARSPQDTCFRGCTPGQTVNLSALAGGESPFTPFTLGFAAPPTTVNGVTYAQAHDLASTMRFRRARCRIATLCWRV